jgi:hypothetical protein
MIEKGNASVMITAVEPVSEQLYLYEPNEMDEPVVQHLEETLNSVTSGPLLH